jgi:threonine/homoserine/homoserine lactone efflux protein
MIGTHLVSSTFVAFFVASFILAITPGPGVVYIVTRTVAQGRRAGLASVGGIALGNLGNAFGASIGLAAVFAASSAAFAVVRFAGAGYLILLGIRALRRGPPISAGASSNCTSPLKLFLDGFLVALLNPKTALFFAALLPQFMNPTTSPLEQSLVLGCVFVSIAMCTDTIYALTASFLASRMNRGAAPQILGRYISAITFIGLGFYAALATPRVTVGK